MLMRWMVMSRMGIAFRRMRMERVGIGAALRIERSFDLDHAGPQPPYHGLYDVIPPDAQGVGHDLGRQMTVTEMPGDPDQTLQILAANLCQRLRRGGHPPQPAPRAHH